MQAFSGREKSVTLATVPDLRERQPTRKSPLQRKDGGFSRPWCPVVTLGCCLHCALLSPPGPSRLSVMSVPQSILWRWYLGTIKASGQRAVGGNAIWKGTGGAAPTVGGTDSRRRTATENARRGWWEKQDTRFTSPEYQFPTSLLYFFQLVAQMSTKFLWN